MYEANKIAALIQ